KRHDAGRRGRPRLRPRRSRAGRRPPDRLPARAARRAAGRSDRRDPHPISARLLTPMRPAAMSLRRLPPLALLWLAAAAPPLWAQGAPAEAETALARIVDRI